MTPLECLGNLLAPRLPGTAAAWLASGIERCRTGIVDRDLYLLMSAVSRHVGNAPLALTDSELAAASASRPGWDPRDWTLDQAVRVYLLCASTSDGAQMSLRLDRLCSAADVGELVALYRGLPLYPDQPRHALRAAEGIRVEHAGGLRSGGAPESVSGGAVYRGGVESAGAESVVRRQPTGAHCRTRQSPQPDPWANAV